MINTRAIAIILVMIGHAGAPRDIVRFVYLFHMPLFFFISGYIFRVDKYNGLSQILREKIRTLIAPAIYFGLICTSVDILVGECKGISLIYRMVGSFIQLRGSEFESGYWFLVCLFVTEVVYYSIAKITRDQKDIVLILFGFSCLGIMYQVVLGKVLPWSSDSMLICIAFFGIGNLLRNSVFFDKLTNWFGICVAALVLGISFIVSVNLDVSIDIYANKYDLFPLFYISAFSGVFFIVGLARHFRHLFFLQWLGKNTLVFYALHKKIFYYISRCNYIDSWIKTIIFTIIVMIPITLIINGFVPFLNGKRKQ